jgi:hypothetical protein
LGWGKNKLELIYIIGFELLIIISGVLCFFTRDKGILMAIVILSLLNFFRQAGDTFWRWELAILLIGLIVMILVVYLDHLSNFTYIVNLSLGGMGLLTISCIFMALLPAIIFWILLFGIPVLFTARHVSKRWLYLTVCLRTTLPIIIIIVGNYLL